MKERETVRQREGERKEKGREMAERGRVRETDRGGGER